MKYFIEKIHLFEVDPNSDAVDLLELNEKTNGNPEWITDSLIEYLQNDNIKIQSMLKLMFDLHYL